ncbi:hypothetical protein SAMN04488515_2376 [Cognatiyoonia koreensis]|uniref:Beta-lactamase-related domain-containing protein n=1 Tax=Cognatiyoonia koreensis TaxID=364200 RepID=A0A1I0R9V6_9RHOB|nr:serine hydrolase [Cognatiyoonia koreensis]SEW37612.1 hypothetical protein SAMN04488515_2376 [Cognatiyoonia koreensis]
MRRWILRILLALVLAIVVVGLWKREEITRLMAVNSLFAEDRIVSNFSGMDDLFLVRSMSRGDTPVSPLPAGTPAEMPAGYDHWVTERNVTAMVVLHDGAIVFEEYYQGTEAEDLRIAWSISKSWMSALFGILVDEGAIASIDDPVTLYAPALTGTAYDGARIKDVLQMSSGVVFDEDYLDFNSDINKMGRVIALGGSMDAFAAGLQDTSAAPGEVWKYVSIDTHVLSMVLRGATERSLPELMTEKVIAPLGLEADPFYLTDGYGVAFALGGLNLRTRDNARFAQMFANGGTWQGQQIVPKDWVAASTTASAPKANGMGYGYQWWMPAGAPPGVFHGQGIYGQYIYVDQNRNVVIATNAADRLFREAGVADQNMAMFAEIAALFDE